MNSERVEIVNNDQEWHFELDTVRVQRKPNGFLVSYRTENKIAEVLLPRHGPKEGIGEITVKSIALHIWYDRGNSRWVITKSQHSKEREDVAWDTTTIFLTDAGEIVETTEHKTDFPNPAGPLGDQLTRFSMLAFIPILTFFALMIVYFVVRYYSRHY